MRRELVKPGPLHTHDPLSHTLMTLPPTHSWLLHHHFKAAKLKWRRARAKVNRRSRHYSMSVPDAEFQCTERDQSSNRQFSSSHQHTGYSMQPQLAPLSCFHHQDDRDAIHTTARILGVRAAKVQVWVVKHPTHTHAKFLQLKCWQALTFCTRLECRVVSATPN